VTCENRMSATKGPPNADVVRLARWQDRRVADRTGLEPAEGVTVLRLFLKEVA
jgi:hypothetical protein